MFPLQSLSENSLIATFQLSTAIYLNLGRSQNGVYGEWVKLPRENQDTLGKEENAGKKHVLFFYLLSMGECNTILSAYTLYRHLG